MSIWVHSQRCQNMCLIDILAKHTQIRSDVREPVRNIKIGRPCAQTILKCLCWRRNRFVSFAVRNLLYRLITRLFKWEAIALRFVKSISIFLHFSTVVRIQMNSKIPILTNICVNLRKAVAMCDELRSY